jgi:transcriptional regulator with XRE-family HTH domain
MPKRERSHPAAAKFGAIIRRLRISRGWTLRDLAHKADMNATYLGFLERGKNVPTLATILLMAKIFDVAAFEIIREVEGKGGGESAAPRRDET